VLVEGLDSMTISAFMRAGNAFFRLMDLLGGLQATYFPTCEKQRLKFATREIFRELFPMLSYLSQLMK